MSKWVKAGVTGSSLLFIIIHLAWPTLKVDAVVISLLILAVSPWFVQFLKSLELPGGLKIELKDVMEVAKKMKSTPPAATAPPAAVPARPVPSKPAEQPVTAASPQAKPSLPPPVDRMRMLHALAKSDPNLTMVGLRIEIEKRLREISKLWGMNEMMNLSRTLESLQATGAMEPRLTTALAQIMDLGNQAARGAQVDPEAAEYLANWAPDLIKELEEIKLQPRH